MAEALIKVGKQKKETHIFDLFPPMPWISNLRSLTFSENIGRLYENVVLIELKRRDKDVYYWKNKYKCDFLTTKGEEVKECI